MDNIIEDANTINPVQITPTNVSQNNKLQKIGIPILILFFIILLGTIGFLYLKLQKVSLEKTETTIQSTNNSTIQVNDNGNKQINDVELTGWIYLGPRPYQLVYRIDAQRELGKYVLKSAVESVSDVELTKEDNIDQGGAGGVAISPDNTKFIITSVLGDGTKRILIGVNKLKDDTLSQHIELKDIVLPDKYLFTYHNILSWVDNERILIKRTDYDNKTGQITKETYWIAPISNVAAMKEIQL